MTGHTEKEEGQKYVILSYLLIVRQLGDLLTHLIRCRLEYVIEVLGADAWHYGKYGSLGTVGSRRVADRVMGDRQTVR